MLRLRFATLLLFILGLLFGAGVSAQSVDPDYLKIKKARDIAMQTGDDMVYGRYTTDNFWVVMPDGSVQTKQDRIKSLIAMKKAAAASQAQRQPKPPRGEKVNAYGDTIVVSWIDAIEGGKDARFSETWVKQDGTWKCAAAHVSLVQGKP
jgi:hypothetical protein